MNPQVVPASELVDVARAGGDPRALSDAADATTRALIDGFIHEAGPPPARFAWVALGSHARQELHCASDQDHALFWETEPAAATSYAGDLAATVIDGLQHFGMRACDGGYMADRWSLSLSDWVAQARHRMDAPTPEAVVEADVFLDLRLLVGDLDIAPAVDILLGGADSPRLLHGLAIAATSFPTALNPFGRLPHGPVDLKRTGLAPLVLLARLYGLDARSSAVSTRDRLDATAAATLGIRKGCLAVQIHCGSRGLGHQVCTDHLDLMIGLQEEMGMAMMFITHDLGVVAEIADRVAVMYLGLVVEAGDVDTIFSEPKHPYTTALLRSIPQVGGKVRERLDSIKGMVPDPYNRPQGCPFHTRCSQRISGLCNKVLPQPVIVGEGHMVRCLLYGGEGGAQ